MNKKIIFTLSFIIYAIIIIILAMSPIKVDYNDKFLHFFEFLVLTLILIRTISFYKIKYKTVTTIFIAVFLGLITELVQIKLTTRTFSVNDLYADLAGIIAALSIKLIFRR